MNFSLIKDRNGKAPTNAEAFLSDPAGASRISLPLVRDELLARNDLNGKAPACAEAFLSDPAGARTQDPDIKSVVLYQLSYRIFHTS